MNLLAVYRRSLRPVKSDFEPQQQQRAAAVKHYDGVCISEYSSRSPPPQSTVHSCAAPVGLTISVVRISYSRRTNSVKLAILLIAPHLNF